MNLRTKKAICEMFVVSKNVSTFFLQRGALTTKEDSEEDDEEDIDFDDDDFEGDSLNFEYVCFGIDGLILGRKGGQTFIPAIAPSQLVSFFSVQRLLRIYRFVLPDDEEDMLEHYLAEKSEDSSSHSSRMAV